MVLFIQILERPLNAKAKSQKWQQLQLLSLIIKQFGLRLAILEIIFELAAHDRVAEDDCESALKKVIRTGHQLHANIHHPRIEAANVSLNRKSSVSIDLGISHQHLISRNADIFKGAPPVTSGVISQLRTHVTNPDAPPQSPRLGVSQLHYKWVHAMYFSIDDKFGKHDGVTGVGEVSGPEFGGCDRRGVDCELVGRLVKGGGCLEAGDIRSVAQLSLHVGSNYFQALSQWHPLLCLSFRRQILDAQTKYGLMQCEVDPSLQLVAPNQI